MKSCLKLLVLLALSPAALGAEKVDFSHDVVPVLKEYCGKCHTGDKKKGGLSLDTRQLLVGGGENGKAVVVGKSADRDRIKRMLSQEELEQRPPAGPRARAPGMGGRLHLRPARVRAAAEAAKAGAGGSRRGENESDRSHHRWIPVLAQAAAPVRRR